MDFVTHTLVGVGVARLVVARRELLPQFALAAVLGSTLIDGDSWLALLGPDMYGRYHRVATHSILGLVLVGGVLSACLASVAAGRAGWRRFGWYVVENLPRDHPEPERVRWRPLFAVAMLAAAMHWMGDWITGYGNVQPFWPFSNRDVSLHATFSFDAFIFSWTLGWHVLTRTWEPGIARERLIGIVWFAAVAGYVAWRANFGEPTFW